jgi:hypothetical protein
VPRPSECPLQRGFPDRAGRSGRADADDAGDDDAGVGHVAEDRDLVEVLRRRYLGKAGASSRYC